MKSLSLICLLLISCLPLKNSNILLHNQVTLASTLASEASSQPTITSMPISARQHIIDDNTVFTNKLDLAPAVALVTEKNEVYCSGTLIAQDLVLTASHCISTPTVLVRFGNSPDHVIEAEVVKIGTPEKIDLALLKLDYYVAVPAVEVSQSEPQVFEPIIVLGCPDSTCMVATSGIVAGYQNPGRARRMVSEAKVWFGNSGGAALNKDGKLVGVTSAVDCKQTELLSPVIACYGKWVPAMAINKFLGEK